MTRTFIVSFNPDKYCPLLTFNEATSVACAVGVWRLVYDWKLRPPRLLNHLSNLLRDYDGRFFDPNVGFLNRDGTFQESNVDMGPLEGAPESWWEENFTHDAKPPQRVRREAVPRWQSIGSIVRAYEPSKFARLTLQPANLSRSPD